VFGGVGRRSCHLRDLLTVVDRAQEAESKSDARFNGAQRHSDCSNDPRSWVVNARDAEDVRAGIGNLVYRNDCPEECEECERVEDNTKDVRAGANVSTPLRIHHTERRWRPKRTGGLRRPTKVEETRSCSPIARDTSESNRIRDEIRHLCASVGFGENGTPHF
jgi:hypothetical protein